MAQKGLFAMDTPDEMSPEDYGRRLYVEGTSAGLSAEEMQAITKDALLEVRGSRHRNTIPDGNPDKVPTTRPPHPKKKERSAAVCGGMYSHAKLRCNHTLCYTRNSSVLSCSLRGPHIISSNTIMHCAILEIAPGYRALFVDLREPHITSTA